MRRPPDRPDPVRAARRKKMMSLGALLGALAFIWGRYLLAPAPQVATGEPARDGAIEPAKPLVTGLAPTSITLAWPAASSRDPFELKIDAYDHRPGDGATDAGSQDPVVVPDLSEEDVDVLLAALVLQGTMLSDEPQVMINGELFRVGDQVGGFVIRAIENRRVIVACSGVERTLELIEHLLPQRRRRGGGSASEDGEG